MTVSIGLVMQSIEKSDPDRPKVLLLKRDGKGGFEKGEEVELTEKEPHAGNYTRNIFRSHHPSSIGVHPADFLI